MSIIAMTVPNLLFSIDETVMPISIGTKDGFLLEFIPDTSGAGMTLSLYVIPVKTGIQRVFSSEKFTTSR